MSTEHIALETRNFMSLCMTLPSCVLPLVAAGHAERAAELYALDTKMPFWQRSVIVGAYRKQLYAAISAALPAEALNAALECGRSPEHWTTARALLDELEDLKEPENRAYSIYAR